MQVISTKYVYLKKQYNGYILHTYMLKYFLPVPQTVCRPVRTYPALPPLDPFDAGSLRSFHTLTTKLVPKPGLAEALLQV